jgi:hypothetical protein
MKGNKEHKKEKKKVMVEAVKEKMATKDMKKKAK